MGYGSAAVVAGVAQITHRNAAEPRDSLTLMVDVAERVLADATGGNSDVLAKLSAILDGVAVVNVTSWQYPGGNERLPQVVADRLSLNPRLLEYSHPSGDSPQRLVNDAATLIERGAARAFLIVGAEGTRSAAAVSSGTASKPDTWPEMGTSVLKHQFPKSRLGKTYGVLRPTEVYPFFETAYRASVGRAPAAHMLEMGRLFSHFSDVASKNPYAWFNKEARTAEAIATPSKQNRMIVYPYTKLMNSFPTVDMAAGVLVISEQDARKVGIAPSKFVYLMGGASLHDLDDHFERRNLANSPSIRHATQLALEQAGVSLPQIDKFDLYSCFPSAVEVAMREIGIAPRDPRPLTVCGGLPFNGGPFNNYVMHAIASLVTQLRADSKVSNVLVVANGGYLTKHTTCVYGRHPGRITWTETAGLAARLQRQIDDEPRFKQVETFEGPAIVDAYCVRYTHDGKPDEGIVVVRRPGDELIRTLAYVDLPPTELHRIEQIELVGRVGSLIFDPDNGTNRFRLDAAKL